MKDYGDTVRQYGHLPGCDEQSATYPLETGGETSTTTSSQAGCLDLVDDPVVALGEDLLRLVPVAHLLRCGKGRGVAAHQVLEDTVLILEASIGSDGGIAARGLRREPGCRHFGGCGRDD